MGARIKHSLSTRHAQHKRPFDPGGVGNEMELLKFDRDLTMAYRMWLQSIVMVGKWRLPSPVPLGYNYTNFDVVDSLIMIEVFSDEGSWKCSP